MPTSSITKVEVLIAAAILATAAIVITSVVQKVREAEARTQSINNLKQLGLGMQSFHDGNKVLPFNGSDLPVGTLTFRAAADLDDTPRTGSWMFQLMPYTIGLMDLWPKVRELELSLYSCPGRDRPKREEGKGAWSDYFINNYLNDPEKVDTPNNPRAQRGFADITDGTSNTIFAGHGNIATGDYSKTSGVVGSSNIFQGGTWGTARGGPNWRPGTTLSVEVRRDSAAPPDFRTGGWGGPFSQGGLFALCDGTVRMVGYHTSGHIFGALLTPTGNEKVDLPD